jgi:hypothetical protein
VPAIGSAVRDGEARHLGGPWRFVQRWSRFSALGDLDRLFLGFGGPIFAELAGRAELR